MDIEAVDTAGGEHIAQALQRRADQGGAAIPFIQKLHGFRDDETISRDALAQRGYLTCHGVRLGLLLRRHPGVECDLYGVHACCLLPTCCVCGARSAGWGAPARGAGRRVIGTTRSYACATQVGLPQVGSNVMRTARVMLPVCPRRATRVSLPPGRRACTGRHALQRCPQKPLTIPGSQLGSWNTGRELYRQVSNFEGSVNTLPCAMPLSGSTQRPRLSMALIFIHSDSKRRMSGTVMCFLTSSRVRSWSMVSKKRSMSATATQHLCALR